MKQSMIWWNKLGQTKRLDLSMDYYGTDLLLDDEIQSIYEQENRYYIEFDKKKFLCLFPLGEKDKEKSFKTIHEALDYMLIDCKVEEITVKN